MGRQAKQRKARRAEPRSKRKGTNEPMAHRRIFIPTPATMEVRLHGTYDPNDNFKMRTKKTTFFDFLEENIFADRTHMGKKTSEIHEATQVLMSFKDKAAGDYVDIDGSMWSKMTAVCEEGPDSGGWSPWYNRQFAPWLSAIKDAKEAPPPPPPKPEETTPPPAN